MKNNGKVEIKENTTVLTVADLKVGTVFRLPNVTFLSAELQLADVLFMLTKNFSNDKLIVVRLDGYYFDLENDCPSWLNEEVEIVDIE